MARNTRPTLNETNQLNETGRRRCEDRRKAPSFIPADRRKVTRRRNIDPTTCERDYSEAEIEFMKAMDDYKRSSGRMFPTCSEILEVVIKLGYRKVADHQPNLSHGIVMSNEQGDAGSIMADA